VVHFAAESHVDRSILGPTAFVHTNVMGTATLLEAARTAWTTRPGRFLQVSTDEVYGETADPRHGETAEFGEESRCKATNPYAATKVGAESLAWSYFCSYQVPVVISRGNNVYGPGQYPEKLVPRFCMQALLGLPHTVQGDGSALRSFVFVEDAADAFLLLARRGRLGEIYNIGSRDELSVLQVSGAVGALVGAEPARVPMRDRNFNDKRYLINSDKIKALGWEPRTSFAEGLEATLAWYRERLPEYSPLFQ